jgi:hypothetical protein
MESLFSSLSSRSAESFSLPSEQVERGMMVCLLLVLVAASLRHTTSKYCCSHLVSSPQASSDAALDSTSSFQDRMSALEGEWCEKPRWASHPECMLEVWSISIRNAEQKAHSYLFVADIMHGPHSAYSMQLESLYSCKHSGACGEVHPATTNRMPA